MQTIKHKRGDTIAWTAIYEEDGTPVNLTSHTITCQVRKRSNNDLVGTLTVTKSNQTTDPGEYTLSQIAATVAAWPVTELVADIQYSVGGVVASSETFGITLEADVTV